MRKPINVLGDVYGKLTVTGEAESIVFPSGRKQRAVTCKCECGEEATVNLRNLRSGSSTSCGCIVKEMRKSETTHGKSKTKEYKAWQSMMQRCYNEDSHNFYNYGERGICVCGRWLDASNFLFDMGKSPKGTSLDRIDNYGNYEPSNCRWATAKQQVNNRRPYEEWARNNQTK